MPREFTFRGCFQFAGVRGRRRDRGAQFLEPHLVLREVARCESRLTTSAQNGQYLGLFQMGSSERRLFGHGTTAIAQVRAAHRYFVASGRDWSPWSCKPWS